MYIADVSLSALRIKLVKDVSSFGRGLGYVDEVKERDVSFVYEELDRLDEEVLILFNEVYELFCG